MKSDLGHEAQPGQNPAFSDPPTPYRLAKTSSQCISGQALVLEILALAYSLGTRAWAAEPLTLDLGPLGANQVAYSADGKLLGVATYSELVVIDAATGDKRARTAQTDVVWSLAFRPDASRLACAVQSPAGKPVKIYDVATLKTVADVETGSSAATAVRYSVDSKILAIGRDKNVLLVDAVNLTAVATINGHQGSVGSIAFSPDGKLLASACWGGILIVWDIEKREQRLNTDVVADRIMALAFSPNSKWLAAVSRSGQISIWDTASLKKIAAMRPATASFFSASFLPDNKTLVTAGIVGSDGNIAIWNVQSGKMEHLVKGYPVVVSSADVSPDGNHMAIAGTGAPLKVIALMRK